MIFFLIWRTYVKHMCYLDWDCCSTLIRWRLHVAGHQTFTNLIEMNMTLAFNSIKMAFPTHSASKPFH